MTKAKKTLIIIAAAVVPVIAAVLLLLFSGPKRYPWEMTYSILPNDVTKAYIWSDQKKCSVVNLSEDEITEAIHLINQLDKSDFRENGSHAGITPAYGLYLSFGETDLMINQIGGTKIEMNFDEEAAAALFTDQWIINDAALANFILKLSGFVP